MSIANSRGYNLVVFVFHNYFTAFAHSHPHITRFFVSKIHFCSLQLSLPRKLPVDNAKQPDYNEHIKAQSTQKHTSREKG